MNRFLFQGTLTVQGFCCINWWESILGCSDSMLGLILVTGEASFGKYRAKAVLLIIVPYFKLVGSFNLYHYEILTLKITLKRLEWLWKSMKIAETKELSNAEKFFRDISVHFQC